MKASQTEISFKIFQNDLSWIIGRASQSQIKKLILELRCLIYTLETHLDRPVRQKKISR